MHAAVAIALCGESFRIRAEHPRPRPHFENASLTPPFPPLTVRRSKSAHERSISDRSLNDGRFQSGQARSSCQPDTVIDGDEVRCLAKLFYLASSRTKREFFEAAVFCFSELSVSIVLTCSFVWFVLPALNSVG